MKILTHSILIAIYFCLSAFYSNAATFTVTNPSDSGAGSLRQAILDANGSVGADDIVFSGISYPATIDLSLGLGELQIIDDLTIYGPGKDSLEVNGQLNVRCFRIESGINVEIHGLTIKQGQVYSVGGGGIYSLSNLTVKNCYLLSNAAGNSSGGGIYVSGGDLIVDSCEFYVNSGDNSAGAIFVTNGSCSVNATFIEENYAGSNYGGGIYVIGTPLNVSDSYFGFCSAVYGGGISGLDSPIEVTNCTFYQNAVNFGGGAIYSTNSGIGDASVTLMNVSMNDNHVSAVHIENTGGMTPTFTTTNSIFFSSFNYQTVGVVNEVSNGYNMCNNAEMNSVLTGTGDITNTDPLFSAAAFNGGYTKTCMLDCYSPAINAGTDIGAPTLDQRGTARLGATDMGAYENINPPQPPINISAAICVGESYTVGTNTYDSSGVYYDTLTASNTCDSIIITTLTVDSLDTTVMQSGITLTSNQNIGTYQWIDCNTNSPIAGEISQSFTPTSDGNYAVVVSIGSCTDTSACTQIIGVGVDEINLMDFNMYPNPSDGAFTILLKEIDNSAEINIYTLSGQLVFTKDIQNEKSLILTSIEPGTYLLEIMSGDAIGRKRVVVN